ncbi:SHUGOSHIN 2-like [Abrus precatorius]|uniref:SHUGOSHIN 2-like n=1 Tax=Abrus precatorius TaxID=3816 RepID=A0A8B8M7I4_ABRPR|nr:SHUGOSHIN 2-like [Abrus precatorius]
MEGGDGGIFLDSDSEPCGVVGGQKAKRGKMVRGNSVSVGVGASQKKMLADITNQQQQQHYPQTLNQQPKQQSAPNISTDQLLKENAMLMKLLANRNAIIESCKVELQKCQSNFQKLRKQNSELALTNSQMLAELNSGRQKLRELQHELGGKNGILNAMKLELTAKKHTVKLKHEIDAKEVGANRSKQSDQPLQEDNRGDAKRKRVSRSKSSAPAVIKQVKSTEKVDNQRYSLRRQSAVMKAEKPEPTNDFLEEDDVSHIQENLGNEDGPTSLGSKVHEEAREDTESSGPTNTEQVHAKKNVEKKRHSLRRQSGKFRPENPEPTEDFFKIDDTKFNVSHLCDNMSEKIHLTTSSVSGQEYKEYNACTFEPQELRRSSVGRPLRRSVEKVVSYKEIPLNVKMRRAS